MQEERDDGNGKPGKLYAKELTEEPRKKTVVGAREHGFGKEWWSILVWCIRRVCLLAYWAYKRSRRASREDVEELDTR